MSEWIKAIDHAELVRRGRAIYRHQGRQIALFATPQGALACNNRCPHEGYPLREGTLDEDCVLTCNWHNWKFNLKTGSNLYGGDQLRIYPTELRDGDVWLDFAEPPFEQRRDVIMANLREAYADHAYDRIARELSRLQILGADPLIAISAAIQWSYDKLEFGWTHAYAGAADWLLLYDEHADDNEAQLACLLEALGHIADDTLREPTYPYPTESQPFDETQWLAAIEAQDETAAIGLLRGALAAGLHFADLEAALSRAALAHYADFGHSLIYVTKAGDLIGRLGVIVEEPLLLALTRSLIYASREDLIPEFRSYAQVLADWGKPDKEQIPDVENYRKAGVREALSQTVAASMAAPEQLYRVLLQANAEHLLHYDMAYQFKVDGSVTDNVGWLDFTHGITFANAVHQQCRKFPELWASGLLQMACFAGRNQPYTDSGLDTNEWQLDGSEQFFSEQIDRLFDHGREEYIVSVHLVKTLVATRDEWRSSRLSVEHDSTALAVALATAINRFLQSPLKRKHVRRTVRQAHSFVAKDVFA